MGKKRKAGEGTLRLRKDGRWEGRIVVDYDENGKPKTKNVTAKTKAECLKKLEALKEKCGIVTGKATPEMPFGDWLDLWYKTYLSASPRSSATRTASICTSFLPSERYRSTS